MGKQKCKGRACALLHIRIRGMHKTFNFYELHCMWVHPSLQLYLTFCYALYDH